MPEKFLKNNGVTVFIVWGAGLRFRATVKKNVLTNGTEEFRMST